MTYLAQTGTFSKNPIAYGLPPDLTITEAHKAKIKLSNGSVVTDWVNGLGTNLYGYRYAPFVMKLHNQMSMTGGSLTLPSILEERVAEQLCHMLGENVPGWSPDSISARFAKTGTDVTNMAIRLARAVTGRDWVLTFQDHYHGWGDWTVSRTEPAHGLLSDSYRVIQTHFNDIDKVRGFIDKSWNGSLSEIACVIFEQGLDDPELTFYPELRRLCDEHGVLLIADEVVTGLRYGLGGVCDWYGIKPDLVCMGKALGNGVPISALVGRTEYMDWFNRTDPVFCSSTHWGEALGLAAAEFVLTHWDKEKVAHLWTIGNQLIEGLNEAGWNCWGHGPRSLLTFENDHERAFFIQGMLSRGFLMNRPNFPTLMIDRGIVKNTIEAAKEVYEARQAIDQGRLEIEMHNHLPRVLFSNR